MSSDSESEELSSDVVFDLLSNTRRRALLHYLRQHDRPMTIAELAREIAAMENEVSVDHLTQRQEKRVYVSLYQTHIPRLVDANIVEYDESTGEVRLVDRVASIDTYLVPDSEPAYPWPLHYLTLAAVTGALLVLWSLGTPGLRAISPLGLAMVSTVAFAISALGHYWSQRNRARENALAN